MGGWSKSDLFPLKLGALTFAAIFYFDVLLSSFTFAVPNLKG
jgi:hypothetical protein